MDDNDFCISWKGLLLETVLIEITPAFVFQLNKLLLMREGELRQLKSLAFWR